LYLQKIHHQYHLIPGFLFHLCSLPQVASNKAPNSLLHQTHLYFTIHIYFNYRRRCYRYHLRRFTSLMKYLIPLFEIFFKRLASHQEFYHLFILKFVPIIIKSSINNHFFKQHCFSCYLIFFQLINFTIHQLIVLPLKFQEDLNVLIVLQIVFLILFYFFYLSLLSLMHFI